MNHIIAIALVYKNYNNILVHHQTPYLGSNMSLTIEEDSSYLGTLSGSDVEGDDLTFTIVSFPENGTLELTDIFYSSMLVFYDKYKKLFWRKKSYK